MEIMVKRWGKAVPPRETELREIFRQEGLVPYTWSNVPGETYSAHSHSYHKVIYVMRGSITWILPEEDRTIEIRTGDRLDLPAGVVHMAQVGPEGVTCLEAHRS